METAEEVVEAVEETLDTVIRVNVVKSFFARKSVRTSLIIIASAGAGAAVSYYISNKILTTKYDAILEEQIKEAKAFYAQRNKTGDYADPVQLLGEASEENEQIIEGEGYAPGPDQIKVAKSGHPALEDVVDDGSEESKKLIEDGKKLAGELWANNPQAPATVSVKEEVQEVTVEVPEPQPEEQKRNVFKDARSAVSEFDYDAEIPLRRPDRPYIITLDEFNEGMDGHDQAQVTYFEEDDVLADSQDQPIDDTEGTVGNANIFRFGYGSKDRNTVYVRNERLGLDFEITRSEGSYVAEVTGIPTAHLQHSDEPRVRRMRRSDDG